MPKSVKATKRRRDVPRSELLRRIAVGVDLACDAATSTLGRDLDPAVRVQALLWIFGYLTGMAMGRFIIDSADHQFGERLTDKAIAGGLEEYVQTLVRNPTAVVSPPRPELLGQLRALAQRRGGEPPTGTPRLKLVK